MSVTPLNISYIDPDGYTWNLSDLSLENGYVCAAISGIEGLPVSMQIVPVSDGTAIPNFYIPQPGTINIAILVERPGDDENAYYNLLDQVVRAFLSRRNEMPRAGQIVIQRPDGSSRQIDVYTTSGLNTPEVGIHNTLYTFTMITPDPFWSATNVDAFVSIFSPNIAPGILPLLPIQFSSGAGFGNSVISNQGTALAYPTWFITGPGIPTIKNITTGRQWSLNTSIPVGNVIEVVTKPGSQMAVNITTGANIWDQLALSSLSNLWPFVGGDNVVNIAVSGATSATRVEVHWSSRWSRA